MKNELYTIIINNDDYTDVTFYNNLAISKSKFNDFKKNKPNGIWLIRIDNINEFAFHISYDLEINNGKVLKSQLNENC